MLLRIKGILLVYLKYDIRIYRVLVGKPKGKRTLGRPGRRWVDNIRMDLQVLLRIKRILIVYLKYDIRIYRVLVGKPEGKRTLGRHGSRWVDNIRLDL